MIMMTKKEIIKDIDYLICWSNDPIHYYEEIKVFSDKLRLFVNHGKLIEDEKVK